jgi:hypothetical protein
MFISACYEFTSRHKMTDQNKKREVRSRRRGQKINDLKINNLEVYELQSIWKSNV